MKSPISGLFVRLLLVVSFLALVSLPLAAQPAAVVNAASFAIPVLPNGSIAQGSLFTVFGSNMGPAEIMYIPGFPLPTELGGTSVQVTVNAQVVDCIMIFTRSDQIAAVLPSSTPVGAGTLAVTYQGQVLTSIPITVVPHSIGIFARNSAGSGPGVLTNANDPLSSNSVLNSAVAGQLWDIWTTGLGPVPGVQPDAEAAGPLPGDLPYDVQVLVGNTVAQGDYHGRSGCCVGVDQVRFVVPAGITGCYVPVAVVVDGVPSNFTTMAISETGGPCSDSGGGLSAEVLAQAQANGGLRIGSVGGNRTRSEFDIPEPGVTFSTITDSVSASFEEYTISQLEQANGFDAMSVGSCIVFQFRDSTGDEPSDPIVTVPLDAGNLNLSGPEGLRPIPKTSDGGYFELLNSFGSVAGYYQPGAHTVTGSGGADIGQFSATFDVGDPLEWTNPTNSISRNSPFTVEWQGGTGDRVIIWGVSPYAAGDETSSGASFWCLANRAAGSFTIPQPVVGSLPPTATIEGMPAGIFGLGDSSFKNVSIPDVDVGLSSYTDMMFRLGINYP